MRADGYDVPAPAAAQRAMILPELYARMGLCQSRVTYMEPPEKRHPFHFHINGLENISRPFSFILKRDCDHAIAVPRFFCLL